MDYIYNPPDEEGLLLAMVCNLPWIACGVQMAPGAAPADGRLAVVLGRGGVSRADVARMLLRDAAVGAHVRRRPPPPRQGGAARGGDDARHQSPRQGSGSSGGYCELHWATEVGVVCLFGWFVV